MATHYPDGYNPHGYRKIGDDVWYCGWRIQVPLGTFKDEEYYYGCDADGSLVEKLESLSKNHPGIRVMLISSARVRMVALDGKVIEERKWEDFYLPDPETKEDQLAFDGLILHDHDGMGNFKYSKS